MDAQGAGLEMRVRRRRSIAHTSQAGLLVVALAAAFAGCGDRSGAAAPPPPPVVRVTPVIERDVPITFEYVGTLVGFINAQIRARVAGHLVSQNYKEGSSVKSGDLLFQVDPRPFQTAADQADAKLHLAESQLSQARAQVGASEAQVEQAMATVFQSEAQVRRAEATQRQTELDVGRYTPLAQRGSVSQQELDNAVQSNLANLAAVAAARAAVLNAQAGVSQARAALEKSQVDVTTGTGLARGVFPNPGNVLRPGQYAKVRAVVEVKKNALMIPQRAVQDVQGVNQVAVVRADETVDVRTVKVDARIGSLWIIAAGLKPGERVIVEGADRVRAGQKVRLASSAPSETSAPK